MSNKVLLGPSTFAQADAGPLEMLRSAGLEVIPNPHGRKLTKDEITSLLEPEVVGLIAGLEPLDRDVLSSSRLKVVSRVGSGMANVDMAAAKELGIKVYGTPDAPTTAVAELTIGGLLALLRQIPLRDRKMRGGEWHKTLGGQLRGRHLVVVGCGRIGRRVAELARAFGARTSGVDPVAESTPALPMIGLDEALAAADVVSLHASGSEVLLTRERMASMKDGALILNAGRGELIDEQALLDALDSGRIAGAWLDVFRKEPYSGPLTERDNVVLTPHVGSYTAECRVEMEREAVENLLAGLGG
jgi:D-3-phosphoglycerate dehydrogenase / 2-oxoglutarate reductase